MTDNESVAVEQIVRSLSFDVVAIPGQSQKVVPTSNSKATPLSVKIRVKKKHEGGLQRGVLAIPVKNPDEVPQRIRLVSSDQTIMSFNAVMEDIDFDKSRARKPILPNIDNAPFTPSTTEACQSEGALKNKLLLSKVHDSNKKKDIFGRCKPGGCLDPPFGEDKYSYEPSKLKQKTHIQDTPERKRTSSIFSNKLFKKIKKSKTDKADGKEGEEDDSYQSVVGLYETGSLQTSASNSIITYPSPSNGSDDKVIQDKQKSPRNSAARKSTESDNGSLYIVPKKTRASLEKEEAKLKSDRNDTNFDLSKELGNIGDVKKLDDVEKIDTSAFNNLDEGVPEYLNTERQQYDVADTIDEKHYQGKNIITTGPEIVEYLSGDLVESAVELDQGYNSTSGVKTGLITAGVAATTAGFAATLLADLKDNDKTTYYDDSVDKLSGDYNEINKTILNATGNKINETATTDEKTQHGSGIDNGDQLSTNTIDYNNLKVNKYEGIVTEDGFSEEGFSNKDSNKITQDETEGIESDTNEFLDKGEDFDDDNLVSKDRGNINSMLSDDLSDNREFDNEISSLDISDKINKQVSKNDIVDEITQAKTVVFTDPLTKDDKVSDSEYQTSSTLDTNTGEDDEDAISVKDNISDKMSKNEEGILSVLEKHKDLQDMLEKGKEFLELDGTGKEFLELDGKGKEFLELNGKVKEFLEQDGTRENIIDNNGKSRGKISNDVNKRDIYSDRLDDNNNLSDNLSKRYQLQPGSSSESAKKIRTDNSDTDVIIKDDESISDKIIIKDDESISDKIKDNLQNLKEIKIKKAADGDKQKKRKETEEQLKTKIDLGFHTYTNEKNELILKSFDSKSPPSRYPRDSIIMTNCDLKDPFELKVPFGTEQYLQIQIKDNENVIKTLPSTTKSSKISLIGKTQNPKLHKINEQMNSTVKNATKAVKLINKDIVKAQMKDIYGTYENELIPLQQSLTRLKQDVDVLILHQQAIRNNLLSKRVRFQGNRKCGCVRKL